MGKLINANKEEFVQILESEKGIILVDFWAPWCAPCKRLGPVLQEVVDEMKDITIIKVNVDNNPELSSEYGVRNIPVVFAIKDGKQIAKFVGTKRKEDIISFIEVLKVEGKDESKN